MDRGRGEAPLGEAPGVVGEDIAGYVEDDVELRISGVPRITHTTKRHRSETGRNSSRTFDQRALLLTRALALSSVSCCPSSTSSPPSSSIRATRWLSASFPAAYGAQRRPAVHGTEADYEAQRHGADKRHEKELQRLEEAFVKGGYYGLEFGHRRFSLLSAPKAENAVRSLLPGS